MIYHYSYVLKDPSMKSNLCTDYVLTVRLDNKSYMHYYYADNGYKFRYGAELLFSTVPDYTEYTEEEIFQESTVSTERHFQSITIENLIKLQKEIKKISGSSTEVLSMQGEIEI